MAKVFQPRIVPGKYPSLQDMDDRLDAVHEQQDRVIECGSCSSGCTASNLTPGIVFALSSAARRQFDATPEINTKQIICKHSRLPCPNQTTRTSTTG